MQRIDTPTRSIDLFGAGKHGFTDGDPIAGVPATRLNAGIFNALQEEIARTVEASLLVLDPANRTQLKQAIGRLTGANITGLAATTVLTPDHAGTVTVNASLGAITLTLPPVAQGLALYRFVRLDLSVHAVTIQAHAGETVNGGASMLLPPGQSRVLLPAGAGGWIVVQGQPATDTVPGLVELATLAETDAGTDTIRAATPASLGIASRSHGATWNSGVNSGGYQRLPGGLILQWGYARGLTAAGGGDLVYPVAFPSAAYVVLGTAYYSGGWALTANIGPISTTGFNYYGSSDGVGGTWALHWLAIGK